jgi:hypothetical protein
MGIKQEKRGTGRTHNMIMEALHIGSQGPACAVVIMRDMRCIENAVQAVVPNCFSKDHHYWQVTYSQATWHIMVGEKKVIRFMMMNQIWGEFGNNKHDPLAWRVPGHEIFLDHLIIEDFYGPILQAWARYDNPHHKVNFHG